MSDEPRESLGLVYMPAQPAGAFGLGFIALFPVIMAVVSLARGEALQAAPWVAATLALAAAGWWIARPRPTATVYEDRVVFRTSLLRPVAPDVRFADVSSVTQGRAGEPLSKTDALAAASEPKRSIFLLVGDRRVLMLRAGSADATVRRAIVERCFP